MSGACRGEMRTPAGAGGAIACEDITVTLSVLAGATELAAEHLDRERGLYCELTPRECPNRNDETLAALAKNPAAALGAAHYRSGGIGRRDAP